MCICKTLCSNTGSPKLAKSEKSLFIGGRKKKRGGEKEKKKRGKNLLHQKNKKKREKRQTDWAIWARSRGIKNYLNHPQHTRLEHRQRHRQASVWNTGPATASAAQSRPAWLTLANHQLKSTKIHCKSDQFHCLQKPKPAKFWRICRR